MLEYECLKVRLEKMLPHIRECQKKWNIPPRAKLGGKVGKFLWGEKGALHPKAGGEANFCNIVRILTLRFWKSGLINDFWTITMGEEVYSYYRRKGEEDLLETWNDLIQRSRRASEKKAIRIDPLWTHGGWWWRRTGFSISLSGVAFSPPFFASWPAKKWRLFSYQSQ